MTAGYYWYVRHAPQSGMFGTLLRLLADICDLCPMRLLLADSTITRIKVPPLPQRKFRETCTLLRGQMRVFTSVVKNLLSCVANCSMNMLGQGILFPFLMRHNFFFMKQRFPRANSPLVGPCGLHPRAVRQASIHVYIMHCID